LALLGIAPLAVVAAPVQDDILETSAEGYLSRGVRMYETKNYTGCIDQLGERRLRSTRMPTSISPRQNSAVATPIV